MKVIPNHDRRGLVKGYLLFEVDKTRNSDQVILSKFQESIGCLQSGKVCCDISVLFFTSELFR